MHWSVWLPVCRLCATTVERVHLKAPVLSHLGMV